MGHISRHCVAKCIFYILKSQSQCSDTGSQTIAKVLKKIPKRPQNDLKLFKIGQQALK